MCDLSSSASSFSEDECCSSSEADCSDEHGGYHPLKVGDVLNKRYEAVQKLGWGQFSVVWLCNDRTLRVGAHNKMVAVKIQKSKKSYTETAQIEIKLLHTLRSTVSSHHKCVVLLLDTFKIKGPNGKHQCLVFELMGPDLLALIKKHDYKGIPLHEVKRITHDILLGLDFLHTNRIIHTDIKPENVVLTESMSISRGKRVSVSSKKRDPKLRSSSPVAKLADMGNAIPKRSDYEYDGTMCTREYRPPENILGFSYNESVDMWSLACMVFELATGDYLFDPKSVLKETKSSTSVNAVHLELMAQVLGPVPSQMVRHGRYSEEFYSNRNKLKHCKRIRRTSIQNILITKYRFSLKEARGLASFLEKMLTYDPLRRISARQALKHPWLTEETDRDDDIISISSQLHNKRSAESESDCYEIPPKRAKFDFRICVCRSSNHRYRLRSQTKNRCGVCTSR
eukprot:120723_1